MLMIFGMLFSHQIAQVFGLDEHAAQLASRNIFWLATFIIGFAIDIILSSALRAAGNAWTPLLFGLAVNIVNLPLLYAFILGIGVRRAWAPQARHLHPDCRSFFAAPCSWRCGCARN